MSSKGFNPAAQAPESAEGLRIAIVSTTWNADITERLASSAHATLLSNGACEDDIRHIKVPGAFELIHACRRLALTRFYDAIIAIGCVVRGGTPHFDYICQGVTQGIATLNATCDIPIIFGVLTVDKYEQAEERCGGCEGDKGCEFALTAISMAHLNP